MFILLYTTFLLADNPLIFSALGDVIYDNAKNINNLKSISQYNPEINKINKYLSDVKKTKENGFSIERGDKTMNKMEYLNHLRALSETNDHFVRSAKNNFKYALSKEDTPFFLKIINSGLIDTKKSKKKIIDYYVAHSKDIKVSGLLQSLLDKNKKLKVRKEAKKKLYQTKKMIEEARIRRIRKQDKEKQEALEKKLEDELKAKKTKIIQEQKSELFN